MGSVWIRTDALPTPHLEAALSMSLSLINKSLGHWFDTSPLYDNDAFTSHAFEIAARSPSYSAIWNVLRMDLQVRGYFITEEYLDNLLANGFTMRSVNFLAPRVTYRNTLPREARGSESIDDDNEIILMYSGLIQFRVKRFILEAIALESYLLLGVGPFGPWTQTFSLVSTCSDKVCVVYALIQGLVCVQSLYPSWRRLTMGKSASMKVGAS